MPDRRPSLGSTSSKSLSSSNADIRHLTVLIAGAGIGGLAVAIGLRRHGHEVHIFEQSRMANEVGAAIHIAPNSNKILRRFGVKLEDGYGAQMLTGLTELKPDSTTIFDFPTPDCTGPFGAPYYLMHRGHLHTALKDKALEVGVKLHATSRVSDVDPERAELLLENGEKWKGDVAIGADGVHSRTRTRVPGAENIKPYGSGRCGFRFLIPMSKVTGSPIASQLFAREGKLIKMFLGRGRFLVCYPCVNNTIMNAFAICPVDMVQLPANANKGWSHTTSKQHMLDIFADIHPAPRALLEMTDPDEIRLWEIMDMDILPTWVHAKLALMGDAAHPFTPWRGQGGSIAIEDGASLAALLPMGTTPSDIPERLRLYHKLRRERAHMVQDVSRKAGGLLDDPQTLVGLENFDQAAFQVTLLSHDEYANSETALIQLSTKL